VAARIPGTQLEVVPFTGHSVVGFDLTGCAAKAISSFFSGQPVAGCADVVDPLAPTGVAPRTLRAIHPPAGLGGRPGRTLVAVLDTLQDLNRQVLTASLQADAQLPSGASFGGLRGGFARLSRSAVTLRNLSFVPGVLLSGSFPVHKGHLGTTLVRISGSSAAPGTIRVGGGSKRVSGTLAGKHFGLALSRVHLARAGAGSGEWPSAAAVLGELAARHGLLGAHTPLP
jgi:hypothetical protein